MRKFLVVVGALTFVSSTAFGQDTGSITITGDVQPILSITYNSHTEQDATGTNAPSVPGGNDLNFTLALGEITLLSRATANAVVGGVVNVDLRSNVGPWRLNAAVSSATIVGGGAQGDNVLELDDFGFGIGARTVGSLANDTEDFVNAAAAASTPLSADPFGGTVFSHTLDDVVAGAELIGGNGAIVNSGGPVDDNALTVPMEFGVPIGMWASPTGGFAVVMDLTLQNL